MNWDPLLANICKSLKSGRIPPRIEKEEHFERTFVEPIVIDCIASNRSHRRLEIASHPWVKPNMRKPYPADLQDKIRLWRDRKEWANATGWGMRHTLDIFVRDKKTDDHECIAIEVKRCKASGGKNADRRVSAHDWTMRSVPRTEQSQGRGSRVRTKGWSVRRTR
jgi:hypothetical protein